MPQPALQAAPFDGVPWVVESLGMTARLKNALLEGGEIELPIRAMIGHHSRRMGEAEELFPCRMELVELGGARISVATAGFLGMNPVNLSHNFRATQVFGIDCRHQAECTTRIPELLRDHLKKGLLAEFRENELIDLSVKFAQAGASAG